MELSNFFLLAFGFWCAYILLRSLRWLPLVVVLAMPFATEASINMWFDSYQNASGGTVTFNFLAFLGGNKVWENSSGQITAGNSYTGCASGCYAWPDGSYTTEQLGSMTMYVAVQGPGVENWLGTNTMTQVAHGAGYITWASGSWTGGGTQYWTNTTGTVCLTNTFASNEGGFILGIPYTVYFCTNGGSPQVLPAGNNPGIMPYGSNYCWTVTLSATNSDRLTCLYVDYWEGENLRRRDGDINQYLTQTNNPSGTQGSGSGSGNKPTDDYPSGTNSNVNDEALRRALDELARITRTRSSESNQAAGNALLSTMSGKLDLLTNNSAFDTNSAREATLRAVTNGMATLQSTMNSNAAQAHGDFVNGTNMMSQGMGSALTNWEGAYSGLSSNGLAVSNAWRSAFGDGTGIINKTNYTALRNDDFWRIPMKTNLSGGLGYLDLNPRHTTLWALAPWIRIVFTWILVVSTMWAIGAEARDKLVAMFQIPGGGLLRVLANFFQALAMSTVIGAFGIGVFLTVTWAIPAVVAVAFSPVTALYTYPDVLTSACLDYAGAWSPYLKESIALVDEWFPLAIALFLTAWRWAACLILDGLFIWAGILIRGLI